MIKKFKDYKRPANIYTHSYSTLTNQIYLFIMHTLALMNNSPDQILTLKIVLGCKLNR